MRKDKNNLNTYLISTVMNKVLSSLTKSYRNAHFVTFLLPVMVVMFPLCRILKIIESLQSFIVSAIIVPSYVVIVSESPNLEQHFVSLFSPKYLVIYIVLFSLVQVVLLLRKPLEDNIKIYILQNICTGFLNLR